MKKPFFALLALAFSAPAFAVPESNYGQVKDLLENRTGFYTTGTFLGAELAKIGYTKFGSAPGEKGCLVIVPGQGEASMKYIEVAYDLSQKGFSPIYAIDHRGQGTSDRMLPDPRKNSVRKFGHYAQDLATLVDEIVMKDPACRGHRMSLLAHSMGGAVTAVYLENEGANNPFQKVAMTSPMMKIAYPQGKTENSVITETFFACIVPVVPGIPHCDDFAPGKGPYDPSEPFAGNAYTHSAVRFGLKKELFEKWPNIIVGGPTVRWVRESAIADKELREPQNTARIDASILLLQASNDTIVDNAGESEFCAGTKGCRLVKVGGANHEILMESDSIRDRALDQVAEFLGN